VLGDGPLQVRELLAGPPPPAAVPVTGYPCRGSGRIGVVPGAGVDAPRAWAEYHDGRLRCAYCLQFVRHDGRGRLDPHPRPPRPALAA
jgi:hypothetical protein